MRIIWQKYDTVYKFSREILHLYWNVNISRCLEFRFSKTSPVEAGDRDFIVFEIQQRDSPLITSWWKRISLLSMAHKYYDRNSFWSSITNCVIQDHKLVTSQIISNGWLTSIGCRSSAVKNRVTARRLHCDKVHRR